jgi:hypothetical protein
LRDELVSREQWKWRKQKWNGRVTGDSDSDSLDIEGAPLLLFPLQNVRGSIGLILTLSL